LKKEYIKANKKMRMPPPEQPMAPHTPKGKTTVTSVVRTHAEDVLYHEEYTPCFLWTLVLAPCFMPFVWYVLIRWCLPGVAADETQAIVSSAPASNTGSPLFNAHNAFNPGG
jgi:hypothetical protein